MIDLLLMKVKRLLCSALYFVVMLYPSAPLWCNFHFECIYLFILILTIKTRVKNVFFFCLNHVVLLINAV